jgi:hypothetical protein
LLSEQEWPRFRGERASGVERIRHRHTDEITTCVSDVKKKATLGANQRRRILQACVSRLKYELIGNGLYRTLPIQSDQ